MSAAAQLSEREAHGLGNFMNRIFGGLLVVVAACGGSDAPAVDQAKPTTAGTPADVTSSETESFDIEVWCEDWRQAAAPANRAVMRVGQDLSGRRVTGRDFKVPHSSLKALEASAPAEVRRPLRAMTSFLAGIISIYDTGQNRPLSAMTYVNSAGRVGQHCHMYAPTSDVDLDAEVACREMASLLSKVVEGGGQFDGDFGAYVLGVDDDAQTSDTPGIAANSRAMVAGLASGPDSEQFVNASLGLNNTCRFAGLDFEAKAPPPSTGLKRLLTGG